MTTKYATTAFGADRETVDLAYPGDGVGLVNASGVLIGDTLYGAGYDGGAVEFPPLPRFAPEVFARARPLDNGKAKQFRKGLEQLDEEGVVQVLRDPDMGDTENVLAAVGQLQFEVFAHRLGSEFGAPTEIVSAPYQAIRLTDKQSADRLRQIGGIRILTRGDGALVALFENRYRGPRPARPLRPAAHRAPPNGAPPGALRRSVSTTRRRGGHRRGRSSSAPPRRDPLRSGRRPAARPRPPPAVTAR